MRLSRSLLLPISPKNKKKFCVEKAQGGYWLDHGWYQRIEPIHCLAPHLPDRRGNTQWDPQHRLNPIMQEVVRIKILKLLDNGIIYPISNSQWVSPVYAVPKKSDFTMVKNEKNELVQTWLPTKIWVCIAYCKLNVTACKDHFSLSFIDQMLERLAGHEYCCFLDGYSGYNQIPIAPED